MKKILLALVVIGLAFLLISGCGSTNQDLKEPLSDNIDSDSPQIDSQEQQEPTVQPPTLPKG